MSNSASQNETSVAGQDELERTLGLVPALAIGTGTMVGGGIFVFPGLAAGRAGPAAMFSFAIGAAALLGGGLLATLSSANASILSASRSIYAPSRDDLVPAQVEQINRRYRTPHVALLLTGGLIAALILFGGVEVPAEVASLLHLFRYGLICVSLLVLGQSPPDGCQPTFRCPGYPLVPILAGPTSFGLVAFMNPLSIGIGGGILLATTGWYLCYARTVTISEIAS